MDWLSILYFSRYDALYLCLCAICRERETKKEGDIAPSLFLLFEVPLH